MVWGLRNWKHRRTEFFSGTSTFFPSTLILTRCSYGLKGSDIGSTGPPLDDRNLYEEARRNRSGSQSQAVRQLAKMPRAPRETERQAGNPEVIEVRHAGERPQKPAVRSLRARTTRPCAGISGNGGGATPGLAANPVHRGNEPEPDRGQ